MFKNIGPATLVAAAFVGPGTITICTVAGATQGYTLLWAMLLSMLATIVLQEMAARLGLITKKGLSDIVRHQIPSKPVKIVMILLMISAIFVGNAAYEAGNISGGVIGLEVLTGSAWYQPLLIGICAFVLLIIGNYKILERALIAMVLLMGVSFIAVAIAIRPNMSAILLGLLSPSFKEDQLLLILGLIGTTVVPYNLFLHASLVKEKWNNDGDLKYARWDTIISVIMGGIVSMAIIIAATGLQGQEVSSPADLARSLEPVYGSFSTIIFAIGIIAAGITSAITAPLAAAYVVQGCMGWDKDLKNWRFRMVWMLVLGIGVLFASIGFKPLQVITFAQVANGLLLPIMAIVLLWLVNTKILGAYKNNIFLNVLAIAVVLVTLFLGGKTIASVAGIL
ncbi:NRAMP (natural resistance-associated macrophage protein) metal ion transporters [Nonlabens sp. Hel1_33_55]|uniref:Nramp family divalent metal transporter n=1 Tax=Nonlabens sp. Hel1_33_55 TaxID=1336802 RepID=UPI000875D3B8|nr:Nramp family divalent metal transporter [Nonlabens sp. Hel1_33_55]SCX98321.1 NRAMP (natural resistance-associated macrophage protein) metal ion transporters [Nonlabens sp. Hel1_33_55]